MRAFDTADEVWLHALHCTKSSSAHRVESRAGKCSEYLGFVARLNNPRHNFIFNPTRMMSPIYAAAELLWYLSGDNHVEMISTYAPQYKKFTENGIANGAYGYRWGWDHQFKQELNFAVSRNEVCTNPQEDFYTNTSSMISNTVSITQLHALIWLLRRKPETRQGVVVMWNGGDLIHSLVGDKKDIPCTLCLNFIVRNETLYLQATMRSNDVWLGLPYDIWAFTCIQQLIAEALNLKLGWYQHSAMSMHLYEKNYDAANKKNKSFNTSSLDFSKHNMPFREAVGIAIDNEKFLRSRHHVASEFNSLGPDSLLHQCLIWASFQFRETDVQYKMISDKFMREYIRGFLSNASR